MHLAARTNRPDVVNLLITSGADVDAVDKASIAVIVVSNAS